MNNQYVAYLLISVSIEFAITKVSIITLPPPPRHPIINYINKGFEKFQHFVLSLNAYFWKSSGECLTGLVRCGIRCIVIGVGVNFRVGLVCVCVHVCARPCMCTCGCAYMCVCAHVRLRTCMCAHVCVCAYMWVSGCLSVYSKGAHGWEDTVITCVATSYLPQQKGEGTVFYLIK